MSAVGLCYDSDMIDNSYTVDNSNLPEPEPEPKPRRAGQFVPGDPRINRRGRPRNFDKLRALAVGIAIEMATDEAGAPLVIGDHVATEIERLMRSWARSKNPILQRAFVEYAYGPPPRTVELAGDANNPVRYVVTINDKSTD